MPRLRIQSLKRNCAWVMEVRSLNSWIGRYAAFLNSSSDLHIWLLLRIISHSLFILLNVKFGALWFCRMAVW